MRMPLRGDKETGLASHLADVDGFPSKETVMAIKRSVAFIHLGKVGFGSELLLLFEKATK